MKASFLPALALSSLVAVPAPADVIVVPPPVGTENVIAAAIASAAPGDTLQLLEGVYSLTKTDQILIDKPLRLLGAGPSLTKISSSGLFGPVVGPNEFEVAGIGAGASVMIQGIGFTVGSSDSVPGAIFVHDCEGVVGLLDCELTNTSGDSAPLLRVEHCAAFYAQKVQSLNSATWAFTDANAQLEACSVQGTQGLEIPPGYSLAGPGLRADRSGIQISGSSLIGGSGGATGITTATDGPGQPAVVLQSSTLTLFGDTELVGGNAGTGFGTGARGGAALSADAFSRVRIAAGTSFTGGVGASGVVPAFQTAPGATVIQEARRAIHLSAEDPVVLGVGFVDLSVRGEPGTPFVVYAASAPFSLPVALAGVDGLVGLDLAQALPLFGGFQLQLDASGEAEIGSTPTLGMLEIPLEYSLQAVEFIPDGTARVSNALLSLFKPL